MSIEELKAKILKMKALAERGQGGEREVAGQITLATLLMKG